MNQIFNLLDTARVAGNMASELNGKTMTALLAVVTNIKDPENMRRIAVALPSKGGKLEVWAQRLNITKDTDEVLPDLGQTAFVLAIDGNPHHLVYLGILSNETNKPLDKLSASNDRYQEVEGNNQLKAGEDITLRCGKTLRLQNDIGAYIELSEIGLVTIGDAFGHTITIGSGSGNSGISWDFNQGNLNIVNAANFSINGKQVTTIGAKDTDNDTLNTRGW